MKSRNLISSGKALIPTSFIVLAASLAGFQNCGNTPRFSDGPITQSGLGDSANLAVSSVQGSVASAAGIREFKIGFTTRLTANGQTHPNHYPAFWNDSNPGYYVNRTGRTLAIRKMVAMLDATPYGLHDADVDVCLFAPLDISMPVGIYSQSEVLCTNQHLVSGQWPKSTWEITFPGQGHLVPPGALVACDSQGSTRNRPLGPGFSNFHCELTLVEADPNSPLPLVQSLRVPFIDEAFMNHVSRVTKHSNTSGRTLKTQGFWLYNGTQGKATQVCVQWNNGTAREICYQANPSTSGNRHTQDFLQPFSEVLNSGANFSASCHVPDGDGIKKDCAFYFMVEVPKSEGAFHPLRPVNSIVPSERDTYCRNPYPANYLIMDPSRINESACRQTLGQ